MAKKRVSVSAIVTAYNNAAHIADAVASIRGQSVLPDEIIVIDDGSADDTPAIVSGLGPDIRYVRRPNGGEAVARNQGIALARSDVIGFLDADDAWPGGRLEQLLRNLTDGVDIVCGRARSFDDGSWVNAAASNSQRPEGHMMSFGCSLIRRPVFERVGGVEETKHRSVDLDWFLRCREQRIPIVVLDEVVLLYRRHDQNMTNDVDASRDRVMQAVKVSLDRRRSGRQAALQLPPWETLGHRKP